MKSYSELITLPTYEERLAYLQLDSSVGDFTFNGHRYLNQQLYASDAWGEFRNFIIVRDNGCDLAIPGMSIFKYATVHHMNPITIEDIYNRSDSIFDPENVILCSSETHKLIHYGNHTDRVPFLVERKPNDTTPWKV